MRIAAMLLAVLVLVSPASVRSDMSGVEIGDGSQLTARFMGVSTILLSDGETGILIDGFFSRPSLPRTALSRLTPNHDRIRRGLERAGIETLAGVLVAHAHHDHAMDSAVVADLTQAVVIGSPSVANIGRGHPLPESRVITIGDGDHLTCGQFRIDVIATPHTPQPLLPLLTGVIDEPLDRPAHALGYKDDVNFSFLVTHRGRRILIHPSAHPGDDILRRRRILADVIFLGIGYLGRNGRDFTNRYWRDVVHATEARTVVPVHWDDFFRSLDSPLAPLESESRFGRVMAQLASYGSRDNVEIRMPPLFTPFDLGAPTAPAERDSSSNCALAADRRLRG